MEKKLTYRQQKFLSHFLDIYQEMDQPVPYGTVAERLGIGKVTAYEMLRLLEERGLIRTEYQVNSGQHGPGRSAVLFYPTQEAKRLMNMLAGNSVDIKDWLAMKERILQQLRDGKAGGYEDLLSDLLDRVSEKRSPLIFVTELNTAVILMLTAIMDAPEIQSLLERLKQIGLSQKVSLNVMSGIAMFLSVMERTNRYYSSLLLTHFNHYEDALYQLNEEKRRLLGEFTREAIAIVAG
jgi:predicted ArsR family transcriptional regulator